MARCEGRVVLSGLAPSRPRGAPTPTLDRRPRPRSEDVGPLGAIIRNALRRERRRRAWAKANEEGGTR